VLNEFLKVFKSVRIRLMHRALSVCVATSWRNIYRVAQKK